MIYFHYKIKNILTHYYYQFLKFFVIFEKTYILSYSD